MMHSVTRIGLALFFCVFIILPAVSHAEECGSIIGPENWFNTRTIVTTPIENCDNPFGATTDTVSPYILKINTIPVPHNTTVEVPEGGTTKYEIEGDPLLDANSSFLFLHEGSDYRYINTKPSRPIESDYRKLAQEFFPQGTDIEVYVATALNLDLVYGMNEDEQTAFWDYWDYVNRQYVPQIPALRAGTYTYVIHDYDIMLVQQNYQQNFIQRIFSHVVPTAYAQEGSYIFTITFTITEKTSGASSIVFLPGIMGSRLYEESTECDSTVSEQERWVTSDECSQLRLMTSVAGVSNNAIYTKDDANSVIDEAYTFNLYKTFLNSMRKWKEEGVIADYEAVPYDWRLRLDDILKSRLDSSTGKITYDVAGTVEDGYLYQTIESLAKTSASGKVTIVAHSNGGLVAKALLASLQNTHNPLLSKIDTVILVGVPQVGTPDAIVGVLHGSEIGPGGVILSQEMTRTLMSTMPFARHLLPTKSYFNSTGVTTETPVIQFESGEVTTPWSNTFGSAITDEAGLYSFLRKESGRTVPTSNDLLHPAVIDGFLFDYATTIEQLVDSWTPSGIHVYQIAGVGLNTPSSITYFTDRECTSRNPLQLFKCTEYKNKLGYRVNHTIDGDGTVVSPSALAMREETGVERLWLNFKAYNKDVVANRKHKDILEVQDVIDFIRDTLESKEGQQYTYLSNSTPVLPEENRMVFYLHSPLDMSITTASGEKISSSTNTISGAMYRRYGELQYISVPETTEKKTLILKGEKEGSFTLDIEAHGSGGTINRHTYSAIPSGTSTLVQMALSDSSSVSSAVLSLDYDDNGTSEIKYNEQGEMQEVVTYDILIEALRSLILKSSYKNLLVQTAVTAREYYEKSNTNIKYKKLERATLFVLSQQIALYERVHLISNSERQKLSSIINILIK